MTRRQVLLGLFVIELIVALIVMFNFGYLTARLQPAAPVDAANQNQAATTGNNAAPAAPAPAVLIPELSPAVLTIFAALPPEATPGNYKMTDALVNLGRMLWYDKRLSKSQQQNCNSCHLLDRYGVDGFPLSIGHDNKPVRRNAQSVYNAAFHVAQFWDGRAPTVEEQAKMPIMSQTEMSMKSPAQVEAILRSIPGYVTAFAAAFPDDPNPITFDHLAQSIGAFERRLVTPSRFDRFLNGEYGQLSPEEQRGLARFISTGCVTCHVGVTVGGLMFKKLGEVEPYQTADNGRFDITGLESDRHVFKVQSLRNIVKTAPYLHDGSIQTLPEMVRLMGRYQLGKQLTDAEIAEIITFLNSLTGEIPANYIIPPALPENGPDTQLALQAN
jgi:cytochrome c peroxidase